MSDALHFLTIAEASRLIQSRKLSPVELTQAFLTRIAAIDPALHSYILVLGETALAEARQAEAEIMAGRYIGPLHGIPIALKDIYCTAGITTTAHSALYANYVPQTDATTVRLLRQAGAIVLGKAATWEFAIGGSSFDLPWPPARNPWDLERDPSGSSSGSGAAVAAGLCMGAMGSDTGGSIRGPAAWCGIAGHKPTYGLVSRRGVLPLSYSLDHAGPMCWTAEDCALMMSVLAQHDPQDPASANVTVPDFTTGFGGGLAGVRIGVVRHFFETDAPAEPEILAATEQTLAAFRDLGAVVSDVTLSPFSFYDGIATIISRSEAFSIHKDTLTASPEKYGAYGRQRLMAGAFFSGTDYVNAQRHRAKAIADLAVTMQDVDLLVFPSARRTADTLGTNGMAAKAAPFYNRPFNLTGSPAVSVCNGYSETGMPFGFQIGGRPFEDDLVLRAGDAVERTLGTRTRRPTLAAA
ncbi:amidase [Acidisphaera sp. L21]|uniref:amidase n=1 Tax=Acidisphaera sp. L21 TaxID=1641851 RepID=UPI00131E38B8|nr:amidase [Acidisphaera sp. L21]